MKKLFALIVAVVVGLIMTGGIAAVPWYAYAPAQAEGQLQVTELLGKSFEDTASAITAAGYYYVIRQLRDGPVITDTRPGEGNPLPEEVKWEYEGGSNGEGAYRRSVFYVYSPENLAEPTSRVYYNTGSSYLGWNLNYADDVGEYAELGDSVVYGNGEFTKDMSYDEIIDKAALLGWGVAGGNCWVYTNICDEEKIEWLRVSDGIINIDYYFVNREPLICYAFLHEHHPRYVNGLFDSYNYSFGINTEFRYWYSWDTENHWVSCNCGQKTEFASHTFENGTCTVCGAAEGVIPEPHEHESHYYDSQIGGKDYYGYNDEVHWDKCYICGSRKLGSESEHYFRDDGTCRCGKTGEPKPAPPEHEHVFGPYTKTSRYWHKRVCQICGYTESDRCQEFENFRQYNSQMHVSICECGSEFKEDHRYVDGSTVCADCGFSAGPHEHEYVLRPTSAGNRQHANFCKICGDVERNERGWPIYEYHRGSGTFKYDENYHAIICSICGYAFRHGNESWGGNEFHDDLSEYGFEHTFVDGVCLWCGYVEGSPIHLPGDLNSSGGEPDVLDGVVMQRILASLEPEITAADLNRDGIVNVADGVVMQRILAGLE